MRIVGTGATGGDGLHVHTIDVWFSQRLQAWLVERLDGDGHQIGFTHRCASEEDAASCVAEWLRTHGEAQLLSPQGLDADERRLLSKPPHRRAA